MTATSGPGISLMSELAGLGYYAEVPAVIWDVQRIGPSTGLPTRTSQGDMLSTAFLSHGDTRHLLLFPGTMTECFTMAGDAFDLAERFQTPVFVLSDLDLGMNTWMSDPFPYPDKPLDRGKVLSAAALEKVDGFARYDDPDGDGIGWRTLPGTDHPKAAYFSRGSGHDEGANYTERPEVFERNMARLARKIDGARTHLPAPVQEGSGSASIGIVAVGSSDPAVREAIALLRSERGLDADYLRIRAYPFAPAVREFVERHARVYVVEQDRDAQLAALLRLDLPAAEGAKLRAAAHVTGMPLDARTVVEELLAQEGR
jgi:2-oxoglutarate ferredoxin oxidoreductase subunit alpha